MQRYALSNRGRITDTGRRAGGRQVSRSCRYKLKHARRCLLASYAPLDTSAAFLIATANCAACLQMQLTRSVLAKLRTIALCQLTKLVKSALALSRISWQAFASALLLARSPFVQLRTFACACLIILLQVATS